MKKELDTEKGIWRLCDQSLLQMASKMEKAFFQIAFQKCTMSVSPRRPETWASPKPGLPFTALCVEALGIGKEKVHNTSWKRFFFLS